MIWPEDMHLHRRGSVEEIELACPACGHCWYADAHREYGFVELESEDDLYCPVCGVEGEA